MVPSDGIDVARTGVATRAARWSFVVASADRFEHPLLDLADGGGFTWLGRRPRWQMAVVATGAALRSLINSS